MADTDYGYKKQNDGWIVIETVPDEHDGALDFEPSFWFENSRHYIKDFTRCHNSSFIGGGFPGYIHGFETENYYDTLFIELSDDGGAVNVYREAAA